MDVAEWVRGLQLYEVGSADVDGVRTFLSGVARVSAWVEAQQVAGSRRLTDLASVAPSMSPVHEIARAGRSSQRDADRVTERVRLLDRVPEMESKLNDGELTGEHVDVLARGARQLDPADRERLFDDHGARLADLAGHLSPEELAKAVKTAVNRVRSDDGLGRLERQQRATSLRSWVDRDTGMVNLRGEFDPENGLKLMGRLHNTVETLFHDQLPVTCPTDPERKQDHLRALALLALTAGTGSGNRSGNGSGIGRAEMIVVIDEQTLRDRLHAHSIIDAGADVDLPVETWRRIACGADIIPAVLATNGVVVDLGHSARVADIHQRRALRVTYSNCAIDDCTVRFDHCEPHHINYWRHGGRTDIDNLVPLCSRHHHAAHEGGWQLHLQPRTRALTITYPDGTTHTHPPPRARAQARPA